MRGSWTKSTKQPGNGVQLESFHPCLSRSRRQGFAHSGRYQVGSSERFGARSQWTDSRLDPKRLHAFRPQSQTYDRSVCRGRHRREQAQRSKTTADVFSNALLDAPSNLNIILFDTLNIATIDQMAARVQLVKLLRGLKPTDRVGLMILGQRLRIVQGFASDASTLIASVKDFKVQAIAQEPNESLLERPGSVVSSMDAGRSAEFPGWQHAATILHHRNRVSHASTERRGSGRLSN